MSTTTPACMTCNSLGECPIVDEAKLSNGYCCGDWREAHDAKVAARQQILYKFGSAGTRVLLNMPPEAKKEE